MFTPASNEGFNPNLLGDGLPWMAAEQPLTHAEEIKLYDDFADGVLAGFISSDQAKYHLDLARRDVHYAHQLQSRFNRADGFNGSGSVIGGVHVS